MKLLKKRQSELSIGLLHARNNRSARVGLGLVREFWFKISSRCRGVMYSTRSNLSFYSQDFDAGNPLLPQNSPDFSKSGLKKRPSKASSGAYTMGTEGQLIEARPLPDIVVKVGSVATHPSAHYKETHFSVASQITIPFFIAGLGMVLAGIYLDMAQRWKVFIEVPEIIVMVPALLGLKGNLEMTLASRLSTEANLGNMDNAKEQWSMIIGNLTLVQCQAIIIGMLSSWVAVAMVAGLRQEFNIDHVLLLCACSMITASVASFILGLITSCVIVISRWCNINPDNVATPIAGSLGDITSLALLSWVATFLYESVDDSRQISIAVIICYILVMPFWVWFAKNNKYTSNVLYNGWTPVIIAMLISTGGGLILDVMVTSFKGIAVYQPVINGVGGNLVSIQASRLSTSLHRDTQLGVLPPATNVLISPFKVFFAKAPYALTARVLMMLVIPGHIAFSFFIYFFQPDSNEITFIFMATYLCAAMLQVGILLFLAYVLTNWFWAQGTDPDNSTIPYLTAIGDLLGITFLGLTFKFLSFLDDKGKY